MLRKDIGFKLAIECRKSAFDDDLDHLEMAENVSDSPSLRISDTFQIKPDGCSLSEIKASLQITHIIWAISYEWI